MVKELRIYFEGDVLLRPGFHAFFKEIIDAARRKRCHVYLVAANGRPVEEFHTGLKANPDACNVLLLDSEGPLNNCDRSKRLTPKYEGSSFWMVELMESWFLADLKALCEFFRNRVREDAF